MLFHRIELGMTYEAVSKTVGKSARYCDSGEANCALENGEISKSCLNSQFIHPNKTWMCHWEGSPTENNLTTNLEIWFLGDHVIHVVARTNNGMIYKRDSGNTVHLQKS